MLTDRKRPDSFFKPYYDILPATLNNMPVFWNDEEMSWLQGSYLTQQTFERNEAIVRDYDSICGIYPTFTDICTVDEFKWCRMAVCSRNFGMVVNGVRTSAMVPHADMLNHFRPRETKWAFDNTKQSFTVTSLMALPAGKQVYDSYGSKCNHRFLLNYGFSIENNGESDGTCPNEVSLAFRVRDDDVHRELKLGFWSRGNHAAERRTRVSIADNENARQAFSFCRVLAANEDEFAQITGTNGRNSSAYSFRTPTDIRHPVGRRNEIAALELFETLLQEHLDAYPNTMLEDEARLQPGVLEPFSNERHAVIHVHGEKVVIAYFMRLTRVARAILVEEEDDKRREKVEELYRSGGPDVYIANYISSCMAQLREHERLQQYVDREQQRGESQSSGDASIFDAAGNMQTR
jgi:histone-lysine N-methyltransferase SETD3